MKSEDMTREQLIEELTKIRQEISDITNRLNNTLVGVLGNISLAMLYQARRGSEELIMRHLNSAEKTFIDIKDLTGRMFDLAQDGDNE